jgi:hypothetical protein
LIIGDWNLFGAWNLGFGILKISPMHCAIFALLIVALWPCLASSQGLIQGASGILEFNYTFLTTKTEDAAGITTKAEVSAYTPRFTLNIDTKIFPNLRLRTGGIAEGTISDIEVDETDTKTTVWRFRPYTDLILETPLYTAGVGYALRQERTKTSGSSPFTLVNEEYNAILGWRPEGFPSTELRFARTNTFDKDRTALDAERDFLSLTSKYRYKGFTADYFGTYIKTKNNLIDLQTENFLHTGRFTYGGTFFNRVSLSTTYNLSHQEVKTVSAGTGFISLQAFPFAGLSAIDDTPEEGALLPNPAIIDGDLTAGSGINIGVPPPGGNDDRRNVGLDFLNVTEVNQLLVWVNRELPLEIANFFVWEIFTSSDNLTWNNVATVASAPFGPFENRFEINFPNVNARFIKLAVRPLTQAAAALVPAFQNPDVINITELQAFVRRLAAEVEGKATRYSHLYTLDTRTRILDSPSLYHELFYFYTRVGPSGQTRYTLSNGFSVIHRFSRVFSGMARVAREDGKEEDEKRVGYVYTASVNADPLRTLRHSLIFSGRNEEINGESTSNYSIFLNNTAELYKGVDVNLNGGLTFATQPTGERQRGTIVNVITTIVPRRDLTLNISYSDTTTRSSGGQTDTTDHIRRGELGIAYNPFRTVNLTANWEAVAQKERGTQINQNYGLNWSPFPDGTLQFSFFYNEAIRSEDSSKTRTIAPIVRWKITQRSFADLTFQSIKSESDVSKSDQKVISANLKIYF